jgi:hypothetical protein
LAIIYKKKSVTRNFLITRGLGGPAAAVIRQGYLGFVKESIIQLIQVGQSGKKRAEQNLKEIIIGARLIKINNQPTPIKIEGFARIKLSESTLRVISNIEFLTSQVKKTWDKVKISVKRL